LPLCVSDHHDRTEAFFGSCRHGRRQICAHDRRLEKVVQRLGDGTSTNADFEYWVRTDPWSDVSGEASAAHKTTPLRVVAVRKALI
jgi:hypothetical protein